MPWTYSQKTGALTDPNGNVVEVGYSGAGPYANRPLAERLEDRGPIPTGVYTMASAVQHPTCGPVSLPLEPDAANEMWGRSAFLIHGDNEDHTASTGCIILTRPTRELLDASDIRELVVTV